MNIRRVFSFSLISVTAASAVLPFFSLAFFPDDLRKLHDQSQEQREVRREQFRQDILEKRKEIITRWTNRKEKLEERLTKERERVRSEFEFRRANREADASSSMTTGTEEQEDTTRTDFFSAIRKSTTDIAHLLLPLKGLFENWGK